MQTDDFLADIVPRLQSSETALHNGDIRERVDMWSRTEPLSLFGAWFSARGWDEVHGVFKRLADAFSDCTSYENEIIAARAIGDIAYIVALEHTSASINGVPKTYTLRATTVFVREDGEWKVVHRHGDEVRDEIRADAS